MGSVFGAATAWLSRSVGGLCCFLLSPGGALCPNDERTEFNENRFLRPPSAASSERDNDDLIEAVERRPKPIVMDSVPWLPSESIFGAGAARVNVSPHLAVMATFSSSRSLQMSAK